MNDKTKPAETKPVTQADSTKTNGNPAPALAASPAATPLDAIRAGLAAQAEVHTRFDASKYKRKEYDANGNEVPALPRT